jgi:hypothetical protein
VARKMKCGTGTNGIREPKKLTRLRNGYPTSGAKGKKSVKSTNHSFIKALFNYKTKSLTFETNF